MLMSKREQRHKEQKEKKQKENCIIAKDAISNLLLMYIITGENTFYIEDAYYDSSQFYVKQKGRPMYECMIKADGYDFQFLGLNDNVVKRMRNKYDLRQNWMYFKENDIEGLMDMFRKCVIED